MKKSKNRFKHFLEYSTSHKVISVIIILGFIVIVLGNFTSALDNLLIFFKKLLSFRNSGTANLSSIVFNPGNLYFKRSRSENRNISAIIAVEHISGTVLLLKEAQIINIRIERDYLFKSEYALGPEIKIDGIYPEKLVVNKSNPRVKITIEFKTFFIFFDPDRYYEFVEKIKFGDITLRLFYKIGEEKKYEDIIIPMFFEEKIGD